VYRLTAEACSADAPKARITHLPDAANAIRVMSAAEHTGKLILDIPQPAQQRGVPPKRHRSSDATARTSITGGLGGLGLFLAEKMASAMVEAALAGSSSAPAPSPLKRLWEQSDLSGDRVRRGGGAR